MTNTTRTIKSDYRARVETRSFGYFSPGIWSPWVKGTIAFIANNTLITYGPNLVDWRQRIFNRMNATTSLSVESYVVDERSNFFTVGYSEASVLFNPVGRVQRFEMRGNVGSPTTGYPSTLTLGQPVTTRVHNQVVTGFIKKCISEQRTFQGGVFLGELRETIHLIRHPLLSLRRGFDDYLGSIRAFCRPKSKRDRDISRRIKSYSDKEKRASVHKKAVSDTWLEYSFGLKPLISDIDDGLKTMASFLNYKAPSKFISFTAMEESKLSTLRNDLSNYVITLERVYRRSNKYSERLYGIVSIENGCQAIGTDISSVLRTTGLDLSSFVPTLYELIPYSFLVDYFLNLGDIIEAACFNRSSLKWASLGTLHEQTLKLLSLKPIARPNFGYKLLEVYPCPGTPYFSYTCSKKSRSTYTGSYIPSLEFTLPLSVGKLLNMGALLSSSKYTSGLSARSFRI